MKVENAGSVEEYILSFPESSRELLYKVRKIILNAVPKGTTETIAYKMPTYRNKGNLIHFALFSNHLGIYPGPGAISALKEDLGGYKTSKGAIQIPLNAEIPEKLIRNLVNYNVESFIEKQEVNWHKYREKWLDAVEIMESLVIKTELVKSFKWGTDVYTYQSKNVVGWGGFKDFFSIWFYNGVFLEDKAKMLISAQDGKTKSLRQWRFTDVNEMNESLILAYIEESIQTIKEGKEIVPAKPTKIEVSGFLKDCLQEDEPLRRAFELLSPGKRNEYIKYLEEAKQDKTKIARFEKIRPLILNGKSLNDKYKR